MPYRILRHIRVVGGLGGFGLLKIFVLAFFHFVYVLNISNISKEDDFDAYRFIYSHKQKFEDLIFCAFKGQ